MSTDTSLVRDASWSTSCRGASPLPELPDVLYVEGGPLARFDADALRLEDHHSRRARMLYEAMGELPVGLVYVLGELPDGRWALVGAGADGHRFAVEPAEGRAAAYVYLDVGLPQQRGRVGEPANQLGGT